MKLLWTVFFTVKLKLSSSTTFSMQSWHPDIYNWSVCPHRTCYIISILFALTLLTHTLVHIDPDEWFLQSTVIRIKPNILQLQQSYNIQSFYLTLQLCLCKMYCYLIWNWYSRWSIFHYAYIMYIAALFGTICIRIQCTVL